MLGKTITFILGLFIFSSFATRLPAIEQAQIALAEVQGLAWLDVVDKGNYQASWEQASNTLKLTLPQAEWIKLMNKMRKPLGSVVSRNIADVRTSTNPPGAPAGDYVILVYTSSFSNKEKAQELLILSQGFDHQWKPMSYYVKTE